MRLPDTRFYVTYGYSDGVFLGFLQYLITRRIGDAQYYGSEEKIKEKKKLDRTNVISHYDFDSFIVTCTTDSLTRYSLLDAVK